MAYDSTAGQVKLVGCTAAADYSAVGYQFKFVRLSAAGVVTVCDNANDKPIGVLYNRPTSGEAAEVVVSGIVKVQGDADLSADANIGTSADGQAVAKTAGTAGYIVGTVIHDNAAAGGLATAVINCACPAKLAA